MFPSVRVLPESASDDELEAALREATAHHNAVTARVVGLLAEADRRGAWQQWDVKSFGHWVSWQTGASKRTADARVRMARRLPHLPRTAAAFERGELSESRVRAICRVGTPANEGELLELARHSTIAQLERLTRSYERVVDDLDEPPAETRPPRRFVSWHWDDDGTLVLRARLAPEEGALVVEGLEAAKEALVPAADPDPSAEDETPVPEPRRHRPGGHQRRRPEGDGRVVARQRRGGAVGEPPGRRPRRAGRPARRRRARHLHDRSRLPPQRSRHAGRHGAPAGLRCRAHRDAGDRRRAPAGGRPQDAGRPPLAAPRAGAARGRGVRGARMQPNEAPARPPRRPLGRRRPDGALEPRAPVLAPPPPRPRGRLVAPAPAHGTLPVAAPRRLHDGSRPAPPTAAGARRARPRQARPANRPPHRRPGWDGSALDRSHAVENLLWADGHLHAEARSP